jgi:ubiquitin C-terminal hydrolase
MMVRDCTSTCYVLFSIVVVPASDTKDLLLECVTMFTAQSTGLIWVGLVE